MWSAAGAIAGYDTLNPTTTATGAAMGMTLRTSADVGIVYITGSFSTGATVPAGAITTLPAPYRPLAVVVLTTDVAGVTFSIGADGRMFLNGGSSSSAYNVRSFYFTTVIPA